MNALVAWMRDAAETGASIMVLVWVVRVGWHVWRGSDPGKVEL